MDECVGGDFGRNYLYEWPESKGWPATVAILHFGNDSDSDNENDNDNDNDNDAHDDKDTDNGNGESAIALAASHLGAECWTNSSLAILYANKDNTLDVDIDAVVDVD